MDAIGLIGIEHSPLLLVIASCNSRKADMGRDAARYAKFLRTYRTTVANLGISLLNFTDILIYSGYKIS